MTAEQFTYWLQGFSELECGPPNKEQWKIIQDHLNLVFTKKTPVYTAAPVDSGTWTLPNTVPFRGTTIC